MCQSLFQDSAHGIEALLVIKHMSGSFITPMLGGH